MRLIDADELITQQFKNPISYKAFVNLVKRQPTIEPVRKTGKCVWCDCPYRIEYYWIDREGCTASFADEDRHVVATGIAKFCPNCGRPLGADMRGKQDE